MKFINSPSAPDIPHELLELLEDGVLSTKPRYFCPQRQTTPKMETPSHIMAWGFLVANQDTLHEAVILKSPMGIIMEAIITLQCIISGRIIVSAIMTL